MSSKKRRGRARRTPVQVEGERRYDTGKDAAVNPVLQLQASAGNRAVRGLLAQLDLQAGEPQPEQLPGAESASPSERGFVVDAPAPSQEGGKRLPTQLLGEMERTFNARFSNVRVHEGEQIAGDLGARAVTIGNSIHFAAGGYQPHSGSGREVIAHELTHVVQQRAAKVRVPEGDGLPVNTDMRLENEAKTVGRHAAWRLPVKVRGARDVVRRPVDMTVQAENGRQAQPPLRSSPAE